MFVVQQLLLLVKQASVTVSVSTLGSVCRSQQTVSCRALLHFLLDFSQWLRLSPVACERRLADEAPVIRLHSGRCLVLLDTQTHTHKPPLKLLFEESAQAVGANCTSDDPSSSAIGEEQTVRELLQLCCLCVVWVNKATIFYCTFSSQ